MILLLTGESNCCLLLCLSGVLAYLAEFLMDGCAAGSSDQRRRHMTTFETINEGVSPRPKMNRHVRVHLPINKYLHRVEHLVCCCILTVFFVCRKRTDFH